MSKINKKDLAKIIAKKNGTNNFEELIKITEIFEVIESEIKNGNDINIVGFGTFKSVDRKPRTVVNPKTGEQFKVGTKKAFKFVVGKHIKDIFKIKNK